MSRVNFHNKVEGHRVEGVSNRDLDQKLTYQQLLNLNHDLSKENQQLKTIAARLGQQLKNLHTQFDIRPRDENNELYNAIGSHPILHQYQLTLIPLLDAYEAKIQDFESGFETINEEFINIEKKYIEVSSENERLRTELTDKIKQLVEVYQSGSSEKLGADFGQIILAQINEKQKFLTEENSRLEREFQKYKSESDKLAKQLGEYKRREQEASSKLKKLEIDFRQAEGELKSLKEQIFEGQMKKNDLQNQRKKLDNDLQRAMSQVAQLNKDRDGLLRNYDTLKKSYQRDVSQAQQIQERRDQSWIRKPLEQTAKQALGDDAHKKLAKLQKEYQLVSRQRNKLKEQVEQYKVSLEEANEQFNQIRKKVQTIQNQRRVVEMNEAKNKKLLEQFTEKSKLDLQKARRQNQEEMKRLEDDCYAKLQAKQKKIIEIEELLDKIKLQRDKLQQQNIIHTTLAKEGGKGGRSKDSQRLVQKLREKLAINEQLFKEQLQIIQNDNIYLKRENQSSKGQIKQKNEELRRLKQELQKSKRELAEAEERHSIIIEQIKRVKNQYEGSLRDKERLFEQKIKEIKIVVEESEKRRKLEREKIAQSCREYKRTLEEIRNTYEQRIHVLEGDTYSKQKY